jgi:hypothetical protein
LHQDQVPTAIAPCATADKILCTSFSVLTCTHIPISGSGGSFSTDDGKKVLDHLGATFGLNRRVFLPVNRGDHNLYDPITAALNDGARAVLLHILDVLAKPAQGEPEETKKKKVIK